MGDICQYLGDSSTFLEMRRLLAFLRQSQDYCTDAECPELPPGPNAASDGSGFMLIGLMILFAIIMYMLRPSSLRRNHNSKPTGPSGSNGDNYQPPPQTS